MPRRGKAPLGSTALFTPQVGSEEQGRNSTPSWAWWGLPAAALGMSPALEEQRFVPSRPPKRLPFALQYSSVCGFCFFKSPHTRDFLCNSGGLGGVGQGANQYEGAPFSLKPEVNKL